MPRQLPTVGKGFVAALIGCIALLLAGTVAAESPSPPDPWGTVNLAGYGTGHEVAGHVERYRPDPAVAPAVVTDNTRDPGVYNDFLRVFFAPASVEVSTLGKPVALRAFFGATRFYEPPLPLEMVVDYNGSVPNVTQDLVAMVCHPRSEGADPRYHTWPNLARMITSDLSGRGYACPAPAGADDSNRAYCDAAAFRDPPAQPVVVALATMFEFALRLQALSGGNWLYDRYGIGPNNTGIGLVVRGPVTALTAGEALEQLVVPEYLLKNVSLAEAGCRCLRVAPYIGREQDLLPPDFIRRHGALGADGKCTARVSRLPSAGR